VGQYPKYTIVIPAYNERARILPTLEAVVTCVRLQGWDAEVVVVNDGSTDNTAALVRKFAETAPEVRLMENPSNRGKGYSVRSGLLHAQGADIAIGSRWLATSRQTHRQPMYRQIFGRCFNLLTRMVMRLPYADTQCGFKAFTREAAQTVFQLMSIERWGFDPEILFIARKRHYRVKEVPVSWAHDARTRISYLRDGMQMLKELAIVRWNALLGRYGREIEEVEREKRPTGAAKK